MANLSTSDLRPSEREFVLAMQKLGFGQFEAVKVLAGELILEQWPKMVKSIKFGSPECLITDNSADFQLKNQVVQFIQCLRSIENGEITHLEVRHGLPFAMDLDNSTCRVSDDRLRAVGSVDLAGLGPVALTVE